MLVVIVLLFCGAIGCRTEQSSADAHEKASSTAVAGCYELKLGRWWPWGFGEDNSFVTPPNRIQLSLELGTESWEKGYYLIRAMKSAGAGRRGPSYWLLGPNGRINLEWNDGFTGVELAVEQHADQLRGWAHPHFDLAPLIPRTAVVTAQRIACEGQ
jgi:hypothetical protein